MFYLNLLLSVALFLTVLLTLSRWYRDSEMVVWFTSGQSLTACLKPIMLFAAPFLVAIVLLSLFLSPWAEQRKLEFERQLEQRDEVGVLAPGLFKEFKRAGLVVYVESLNPIDGRIRNVFLHSVDDAKDTTTGRQLGHLEEMPNGDRFVVLENGSRYEGKPGRPNTRSSHSTSSGAESNPPRHAPSRRPTRQCRCPRCYCSTATANALNYSGESRCRYWR
jgi:lipopolysaccharide export system permease protein